MVASPAQPRPELRRGGQGRSQEEARGSHADVPERPRMRERGCCNTGWAMTPRVDSFISSETPPMPSHPHTVIQHCICYYRKCQIRTNVDKRVQQPLPPSAVTSTWPVLFHAPSLPRPRYYLQACLRHIISSAKVSSSNLKGEGVTLLTRRNTTLHPNKTNSVFLTMVNRQCSDFQFYHTCHKHVFYEFVYLNEIQGRGTHCYVSIDLSNLRL